VNRDVRKSFIATSRSIMKINLQIHSITNPSISIMKSNYNYYNCNYYYYFSIFLSLLHKSSPQALPPSYLPPILPSPLSSPLSNSLLDESSLYDSLESSQYSLPQIHALH